MFLCLIISIIIFGIYNRKLIDRDLFELIKQDATFYDPKKMMKKIQESFHKESCNKTLEKASNNEEIKDLKVYKINLQKNEKEEEIEKNEKDLEQKELERKELEQNEIKIDNIN